MDRSLRFRVYPCELLDPERPYALFRLAFATAPRLNRLALLARRNSPDHNAKGTQSPPEQPKLPQRLPPLVGTRFQVLFHSPPGVLFTFPSRYSYTIGRERVFSLGGWSPQIQTRLLEPRPTRVPVSHPDQNFPYRTLTFYGRPFQTLRVTLIHRAGQCPTQAPQPRRTEVQRFGLFRLRSPLLTESRLFSLPPGTEMFQFPRLALLAE